METYNFRKDDFENIDTPINKERRNDYRLFRCQLAGRYGVYIFQTKCTGASMRRTLYVGQGGVHKQGESSRQITDRLAQQYQVNGENPTGQTFYHNWLKKNGKCKSPGTACEFLNQFNQWRLTTITTDQECAIPLIRAVEATLIYFLRPEYNKPCPGEAYVKNARSLDQALCATFKSVKTGFYFVIR